MRKITEIEEEIRKVETAQVAAINKAKRCVKRLKELNEELEEAKKE